MFFMLLSLLHEDLVSKRIDYNVYTDKVVQLADDYEKIGTLTYS